VALGPAQDVSTLTNRAGDYTLYFSEVDLTGNITLEAATTGFQTQSRAVAVAAGGRTRADFQLSPA
jgi:hypothetical protein